MDNATIDYQPQEILEFDTIESLDALMSPFRLQLVECFRQPATAREAADEMGVGVTRLYRHLHRLVEHGFLNVIEERQAAKTVEKVYAVAAKTVRPSPRFMERYGAEGNAELVRLGFRSAESEAIAAVESDPTLLDPAARRTALSLARLRLSEAELRELIDAVEELFALYKGRNGPIEVSLFGSVIPMRHHDHEGEETHE